MQWLCLIAHFCACCVYAQSHLAENTIAPMCTVQAYSPECVNSAESITTLLMYLDGVCITGSEVDISADPSGPVHTTCMSTGTATATIHSTVHVRLREEPVRTGLAMPEVNFTIGVGTVGYRWTDHIYNIAYV